LQLCTIPDRSAKSPKYFTDVDILTVFQRVFVAKEKSPNTYEYFFNHVSVYARDELNKYTSLHCAVLLKAYEEFYKLLARGGRPDARDCIGFSVLARALEQEAPVDIVESLLKREDSLPIPTLSNARIIQLAINVKNPALRVVVNDAIINNIEAFRQVIEHLEKQGSPEMAAEQEELLASCFACPFCEKPAGGPFKFIQVQSGGPL